MNARALSPFGRVYLDAVRAVAAIVVLLGHTHNLFFVAHPADPSLLSRIFYALSARGHDAVIVFFVLSGLLIATSAMRVRNEANGWANYATARAARLYAVLIPALLLGLFWDSIGLHLFGADYGIAEIPVAERISIGHFLASLFFLQEITLPPFGSNQPLWSLAYEAWYYAMFPLLISILYWRAPLKRMVCAGLLTLCLAIVGVKISGYFFIWLMGAILFFLPALHLSRCASYVWMIGSLALLAAIIWLARKYFFVNDASGWVPDMLVALTISLHLYAATSSHLAVPRWFARAANYLAGISFTLYLCHFPLLLLLAHMLVGSTPWQPDLLHLAAAGALALGVMGYSAIIAHFTEARTASLRAFIRQQWTSKGAAYDAA